MKLLKGYRSPNKMFVKYLYEDIALLIRRGNKKLKVWVPYSDYSNYYIVEIGEVVWDETTQNI